MKESLGKKLKPKWLISIAIITIFMTSCYEPIDGCLDPLATNFEFSADNSCESCCSYPNFNVTFSFLFEDTVYNSDSIYTDSNSETFQILDFRFIISEIAFDKQNGDQVSVSDSVIVSCSTDTIVTSNTFYTLSNSNKTLSAENFIYYQDKLNLGFNLGVDPCFQELDEDNLDENFTTYQNIQDQKDESGGFISQYLRLVTTVDQDTICVAINDFRAIKLQKQYDLVLRENVNISIRVKLNDWLEGLDLTDNLDDISILLSENVDGIFEIE